MNATVTLTCNDRRVVDHVGSVVTGKTPFAVVNDPVYVKPLGLDPGVHTLLKQGSEGLSVGSSIRDWRFNKRDRA